MNKIKDITIKNYRGIHYAEVSGMARVNVFLVYNNVQVQQKTREYKSGDWNFLNVEYWDSYTVFYVY